MSLLESYVSNATLRQQYFRMNGYTHAEICDARDCSVYEDESAYKIMLTHGDGIGTWEEREFATIGQVHAWLAKYAPELIVV